MRISLTTLLAFLSSSVTACTKGAMAVNIAALATKIDPMKCMGNWYVQVSIPTPFDRNAHNSCENYVWDERNQRVRVTYTYNDGSFNGRKKTLFQVGRVDPSSDSGTKWQVAPWLGIFYLPAWLPYHIIDIDAENYSYLVASSPSTGGMAPWLYIMTREKVVADDYLEPLKAKCAAAGWDMGRSERVPQQAAE